MPKIEKDSSEEMRYIYATVYASNLYKTSDGKYFTICDECGKPQFVKDSNGYCEDCEEPLGDYHGDMVTPEDIEKAQLSYMKNINDKIKTLDSIVQKMFNNEDINLFDYISTVKHHVGEQHKNFDKGNGYLASCHCEYEDFEAFGETFTKCIWKSGFIVNQEIFDKVKNGEYQSFSFGAFGESEELNVE